MKTTTYEVQIGRILKKSPYHVALYIPELVCRNAEKETLPFEVQQEIAGLYGKKFRVFLDSANTGLVEYKVEKKNAKPIVL
jgi:hypothetical protein